MYLHIYIYIMVYALRHLGEWSALSYQEEDGGQDFIDGVDLFLTEADHL